MSPTECHSCGCRRHSFYRYAIGALCFHTYMALPSWLAMGPTWRFWQNLLLPRAGDYIYDKRSCGCKP